MRKNELYYEFLEQFLKDGQKKEFHEIAKEANIKLGSDKFNAKTLRNILYIKKNKGELQRTEDGKYYKIKIIEAKTEEKKEERMSKYDFSNFVQIKASARKEAEEILSVWKSGELVVNTKLLKHFPENKMEIRISPDASEIVLFLKGQEMINVGKNGRVKNYDLQKKIREQKKNLPAYFMGEWDTEEKLWHGKYLPYNPNKGEKQIKK